MKMRWQYDDRQYDDREVERMEEEGELEVSYMLRTTHIGNRCPRWWVCKIRKWERKKQKTSKYAAVNIWQKTN